MSLGYRCKAIFSDVGFRRLTMTEGIGNFFPAFLASLPYFPRRNCLVRIKAFPLLSDEFSVYTAPFPFPIRISSGFFVNGVLGKGRIQTRDFFFSLRAIMRRPASIGRKASRHVFKALIPIFPSINFDPPLE